MKTNFKRGLALTLSSGLLLSGCGTADNAPVVSEITYELDASTPAWQLDTREDTNLTWYVNADWFNTDYGNDVVTKKLTEDLNLTIEFLTGDDTKLNTYFAGGDLPDIITLFGGSTQTALKADTWALPLLELAEQYDPYFVEVADGQTLDWYKLSDDKAYGYPSYSNSQADYESGLLYGNDGFVIREDIYLALGEPDMSTPEGFLDTMKRISEEYPEVTPFGFRPFGQNGDVGSFGSLADYLGVPITTETGEYYYRNLDEEYLSWIKVVNEAYLDGYVSPDNFADTNTIFEEKVQEGEYATFLLTGAAQLGSTLANNISKDPARKYIAVQGPSSEVYGEPTMNQSGLSGWTVTYISKDCSDPAKAIQLFTYLLSDEGQYLTTYGVEGETYELNEDGKAVFLPEVEAIRNENADLFKTEYRMGEFWFFGHDLFSIENGASQRNPAIEQIQDWSSEYLKPQFLIENTDPEPGSAEARNLVNINTTWATTLASLIQAPTETDFDNIIAEFETYLDNTGFEEISAIKTEKIKANAEKLGITDFN